MPRRLLFKEGGLTGSVPSGLKAIGFTENGFAQSDENGVSIPPPQNYFLTRARTIFHTGGPEGQWTGSITGKDGFKYLQYKHLDVDLSKGNYFGIYIEENIKSLKLPIEYKDTLSRLVLFSTHEGDNPLEINLSSYPNLDWVVIREVGLSSAGKTRPNYLITDSVIDLPKCGALWLGLNDVTLSTNFQTNSLEIVPYNYQWVSICSENLENVNINYGSIEGGQYDSETEAIRYDSTINVSNCLNLTSLTFSNLSFNNLSSSSGFTFRFYCNNFNQSQVDYILSTIDNYFTQSVAQDHTLIIGNNTDGPEFEPSVINQGELVEGIYTGFVVGKKYVIDEVISGDDFSNVGYVENGVEFTATDTTPTNWSNSTRVYFGTSFGNAFDVDFISSDFSIPDGQYHIGVGGRSVWGMTFSNGLLVSKQLCSHDSLYQSGLDFVGKQYQLTGDSLALYNEFGNATYQGKNSDTVIFEVTGIHRNSAPTDGSSNTNYLSLISKGWTVRISKA